jgi:hypothetical protein
MKDLCYDNLKVGNIISYLRAIFDITLKGGVPFVTAMTILMGVNDMNIALNGKFKDITGSSTINYQTITAPCPSEDRCTTYGGDYGSTVTGEITLRERNPGDLPVYNIYHEYGHFIDNVSLNGLAGDTLQTTPLNASNGVHVAGPDVSNGAYDRTHDGYLGSCSSGYACQYEQHPREWGGGNTGAEDFADMFMNYIDGNIDMASFAGQARAGYVEQWLFPLMYP